ncbi:N-alpha-acetyltransferase 16, NatA auxiliary subunit [Chytridiales sp. JEL 0842]|nr:N-alpha-acetyltransferase 16, NatA auxiliary subunit [Chytridiales sp. JEL 0842]
MVDKLPSKENAQFKAILKFHENKQFKKGLKTADLILRKYPDHGETLAMKALFLSSLDRREEAHEFIKKALKNHLTNATCWHVYGLIYRHEKNYEEAVKRYAQAMRFEKENLQIYRDYSMLQIQLRNYDAFVDASMQLILLKTGVKAYWIALAVSFHLVKNYKATLETLAIYEEMFMVQMDATAYYENSEVHLYKNKVLEEMEDYEAALAHLEKVGSKIVDIKAMKEAKARLLFKSGQLKLAEKAYMDLLRLNPDCKDYVEGLQKCKGLYSDLHGDRLVKLFELFEDLRDEFKRSHIIKRVPLNYATGDRFKVMIDSYLRPLFRKGVPSLFVSIKDLYVDEEKKQIVEETVLSYVDSLKAVKRFSKTEDDETVEPPSALLWVYYFLAQHFDYIRNNQKALQYIEEAIKHTPTLVELLMTKARILKHAGDYENAMIVMNDARERDLQDRCINSKCTKYMLRNDQVEKAESTITMFIRADALDKVAELVELQVIWYAHESGMSYVRQGNFGKALKKFHQIEKHFSDFYEDQFDFHNYSLRKMTVRSYIDLLKFEDKLRSHPLFFKTAVEAVKVYLALADKPLLEELEKENLVAGGMSASELKKAMRKAKKAELKSAAEPASKAETSNAVAKNNDSGSKKKVDEDPDGVKLASVSNPLDESLKFLKPLLEHRPSNIESQVLGSLVYLRRKNYLLAWKSLKIAKTIDPNNPEIHVNAVRFWKEIHAEETKLNPTVKAIIMSELPLFFGETKDIDTFTKTFANKFATSLPHVVAAAEASVALDPSKKSQAVDKVVAATLSGANIWKGVSLETAIAAHKALVAPLRLGASTQKADAFKEKAKSAFPQAKYFQ